MSVPLLWSGLALIPPLEARVSGKTPAGVGGISIDSRTLRPGDLFFAVKGESSDGHDYVGAAFANGAAACVVDEAHAEALKQLGSLYVVREVLPALERLARAARMRTEASIVAVTGSVGKTGTKEALRLVLSAVGATHASAASYNNHWGVPLTLARMPAQSRFGVFEIGMNHAGEITPLAAMVRPHVAIITTVAPVHLEYFGSIDGIAAAKAEIFSGLEPQGAAIINRDIAQYELLADRARQSPAGRVLSFGEHADADARLVEFAPLVDGSLVSATLLGMPIRYRLAAPGRHLAMNSLAVLLAAHVLGIDIEAAAASLLQFEPPAGRGERSTLLAPNGPFTLIDESYNANPTSMRAALALLGEAPVPVLGHRIAVLGDMLELGSEAPALHRALAEDVAKHGVDIVYAAGPLMKHLFDILPGEKQGAWRQTAASLEAELADAFEAGDVVMIKGSNGSRMGAIVKALKARLASPATEVE